VVAVLRIDKFAVAEKFNSADLKAGFFFGLPPRCGEASLEVIHLAPRNAPVSGFRRFHAPAQKQAAFAQYDKAHANAREIEAGLDGRCHIVHRDGQALALATISMKAGMSSPKPTGVGPSSWSR
jgi:hypothetical protein